MPTFVATVTDSAGQTTTSAPLVVPAGVPTGGPPPPPPDPDPEVPPPPPPTTAPTTEIGASANVGTATDQLDLRWTNFENAVGKPPVTLYHGYSGNAVPTGRSGVGWLYVQVAKAHGQRLYLNTKTNATQHGGTFQAATGFNLASVTTTIRACVRWLITEGISGWITLDHEPQNDVGADSPTARASAARWRAAQRLAGRAVWAEDPTGQIGYSVCLMSQWPGFPHLQRTFWDPGKSYTDDVAGSVPWTAAERDKV